MEHSPFKKWSDSSPSKENSHFLVSFPRAHRVWQHFQSALLTLLPAWNMMTMEKTCPTPPVIEGHSSRQDRPARTQGHCCSSAKLGIRAHTSPHTLQFKAGPRLLCQQCQGHTSATRSFPPAHSTPPDFPKGCHSPTNEGKQEIRVSSFYCSGYWNPISPVMPPSTPNSRVTVGWPGFLL